MTAHRGALPTLTEVIDIEKEALVLVAGQAPPSAESVPFESVPPPRGDPAVALTTQVLETLRPRIDALLAARLQAAMAPQMERLAEELVRSLRTELAEAMKTLVAQAVDDVLARRRKP
jgi:hypothetical protein